MLQINTLRSCSLHTNFSPQILCFISVIEMYGRGLRPHVKDLSYDFFSRDFNLIFTFSPNSDFNLSIVRKKRVLMLK